MSKYSFHSLGVGIVLGAVIPCTALAQVAAPLPQVDKSSGVARVPKLSLDASKADPGSIVHVIVQFNHHDESEWDSTLSAHGGTVHRHFAKTRALAAEVPAGRLKELADEPGISYVSIDRPLTSKGGPVPPAPVPPAPVPPGPVPPGPVQSIAQGPEYTIQPINAPALWSQGYFGTGIGVAVIDSGIANLPDLGPQPGAPQRLLFNATFPSNLAGGPQDSYGHGTHVAGLIAGNGSHSIGNKFTRTFLGVAPNANLINLRVLDQNGAGTDSSVIEAIEAAIALKSTYNIRVINLSLGRPIYESYTLDPLCQAAEAAWQAGIVVVVAAGNNGRNQSLNPEGYGSIEAPGNDPYVLTVGAMNTMNTPAIGDDVVASYSSKGPAIIDAVAKPDIVAPGNLVTSLLKGGSTLQQEAPTFFTPTSFYESNGNGSPSPDYTPLSGTSMATAVTSGAVALLLQAQPQLTPDQVKAFIMLSAQRSYFPVSSTAVDPVSGASFVAHYDAFTVGAGYLDIQATFNNAQANQAALPQGTAMSPIATYNSTTGTTTLVTDQTALWGRTTLFSASGVYGQNAFVSGSTALWGRATLTGASDPQGFTALWGRSTLFGNSNAQAEAIVAGSSTTNGDNAAVAGMLTDQD